LSKKHKKSNHRGSQFKSKTERINRKRERYGWWLVLGLLGLAILVAAIFFLPQKNQASEISAAQAYQKFKQGAFFLDVRSQAEWDLAHVAGSRLIPLDQLQSRLSELPHDQNIVVVCLSGHRSKEGMTILRQAGFSRAACLEGGLISWKAAGYPLEGSKP
jgi:rhodanese-related sulfurtransferase